MLLLLLLLPALNETSNAFLSAVRCICLLYKPVGTTSLKRIACSLSRIPLTFPSFFCVSFSSAGESYKALKLSLQQQRTSLLIQCPQTLCVRRPRRPWRRQRKNVRMVLVRAHERLELHVPRPTFELFPGKVDHRQDLSQGRFSLLPSRSERTLPEGKLLLLLVEIEVGTRRCVKIQQVLAPCVVIERTLASCGQADSTAAAWKRVPCANVVAELVNGFLRVQLFLMESSRLQASRHHDTSLILTTLSA